MKKGKPKLTREDAERLFAGLPRGDASVSNQPANPFETSVFRTVQHTPDETGIWKDNLITLPIAIEMPAGYASPSSLREAIARAWRVRWVRETRNEVIAEFPEGWKSIRPATGPIELRDPSNVIRAVYGWAEDAELRILPRYVVEAQANSSSGLGSLLIRDRATDQLLERSTIWSAMTGTNHPDWARLLGWLNARFPQHQDPLRYWVDCEENADRIEV
ncbi:hypothetical protein C5O80_13670 [Burkholderia sp. SRS-46]|nr:hypothetical protein C5O80_13670 [Burkholderia sp. SRS-46]